MSELIEKLNWRYAAKRMTGTPVPAEKLDTILEAISACTVINGPAAL